MKECLKVVACILRITQITLINRQVVNSIIVHFVKRRKKPLGMFGGNKESFRSKRFCHGKSLNCAMVLRRLSMQNIEVQENI